jgi:hypothetical protein
VTDTLPGQQFRINVQEELFVKKNTGEELLKRPDIPGTGKTEGDRFNEFSFHFSIENIQPGKKGREVSRNGLSLLTLQRFRSP